MTSVLNVDTIAAKDGTSPVTLTKQSAAKAWNNLSFSGASIGDSFNTASITDNATGRFTCSFTNSFVNANYSSAGSSRFSLTDADVSNRGVSHQPATNSVSIVSFRTDTGALTDDAGVDSQFHGDLA
jgi:hypothetical protein